MMFNNPNKFGFHQNHVATHWQSPTHRGAVGGETPHQGAVVAGPFPAHQS